VTGVTALQKRLPFPNRDWSGKLGRNRRFTQMDADSTALQCGLRTFEPIKRWGGEEPHPIPPLPLEENSRPRGRFDPLPASKSTAKSVPKTKSHLDFPLSGCH